MHIIIFHLPISHFNVIVITYVVFYLYVSFNF